MVDKNDGSESLKFNTSHLIPTTEEVARAFIAAASAATAQSARPSVVHSSKDESGSPMQKLQQQFSKVLKGFSTSPDVPAWTLQSASAHNTKTTVVEVPAEVAG